jgi:hypothetical protein
MTLVGLNGKGLAIVVGPCFNACNDRKHCTFSLSELSDRKDVIGAHADTIFLTFTFRAVNDRYDYSRFFPAIVIV